MSLPEIGLETDRAAKQPVDRSRLGGARRQRLGKQKRAEIVGRLLSIPALIVFRDLGQTRSGLVEHPAKKDIRLLERGIEPDGLEKRVDGRVKAALAVLGDT